MSEFFGDESVIVPDLPEPILAYRAWTARDDGTLVGFGHVEWPADGPLRAECYGTRARRRPAGMYSGSFYEVPAIPCVETPSATGRDHNGFGCGIYGFDSPEQMAEHARPGNESVWGQVELGGKVYQHAHGWRAEYGQVTAVYRVPNAPLARKVAEHYGVPLIDLPFSQAEMDRFRSKERQKQEAADAIAKVADAQRAMVDAMRANRHAIAAESFYGAATSVRPSRTSQWLDLGNAHAARLVLLGVMAWALFALATLWLGAHLWLMPLNALGTFCCVRSAVAVSRQRKERRRG